MSEGFNTEFQEKAKLLIVSFRANSISNTEEITLMSVRMKDLIKQYNPTRVVFDFSIVRFFSSQVLGLLLDTRDKLSKQGGEVVISAINPQLYRVFKITNLEKIFRFFPDKESAVETINNEII